jgi:hypothetical protein
MGPASGFLVPSVVRFKAAGPQGGDIANLARRGLYLYRPNLGGAVLTYTPNAAGQIVSAIDNVNISAT